MDWGSVKRVARHLGMKLPALLWKEVF